MSKIVATRFPNGAILNVRVICQSSRGRSNCKCASSSDSATDFASTEHEQQGSLLDNIWALFSAFDDPVSWIPRASSDLCEIHAPIYYL